MSAYEGSRQQYEDEKRLKDEGTGVEISTPVGIAVDLTLQNQKLVVALKELIHWLEYLNVNDYTNIKSAIERAKLLAHESK